MCMCMCMCMYVCILLGNRLPNRYPQEAGVLSRDRSGGDRRYCGCGVRHAGLGHRSLTLLLSYSSCEATLYCTIPYCPPYDDTPTMMIQCSTVQYSSSLCM